MKTRIFLTTAALCLTALVARAQVSLDNAKTPEAVIGQCPELPAAGTLAAAISSDCPAAAYEAVELFKERMEKIRERLREIIDAAGEETKNSLVQASDKQVRKQTGKSIDEIADMSEAEREKMGMSLADKQLKSMGINKSAKQLANEGMSEAEQQQLASDMAKKMSGMSLKELQALQNMSEEEQMAYMQQGGRMERAQNAASKTAAGMPSSGTSAKDAKALMEISEEMKTIQEQWVYIENQYKKERKKMIEEMRRIIAKYQAQMPKPSGKIYERGVLLLKYLTKEEERLANRLSLTRDTECFTLWRNLISKRQGQLKIRLTDCYRMDELLARQRKLDGMGGVISASTAFGVAGDYLDITKEVVGLPWELTTDRATPTATTVYYSYPDIAVSYYKKTNGDRFW